MQPIKRPSIRRTPTTAASKSQHPIEIQPDYTEDEEDLNLNNPVAFSSYLECGGWGRGTPEICA